MNKKGRQFTKRATPSVAAPGDTNSSDATGRQSSCGGGDELVLLYAPVHEAVTKVQLKSGNYSNPIQLGGKKSCALKSLPISVPGLGKPA